MLVIGVPKQVVDHLMMSLILPRLATGRPPEQTACDAEPVGVLGSATTVTVAEADVADTQPLLSVTLTVTVKLPAVVALNVGLASVVSLRYVAPLPVQLYVYGEVPLITVGD